jgi:DNA-binding PadR family transcriptional regulator
MSVRHGLLALLASGPSHGYDLKLRYEASTGGTRWVNGGQIYTTLRRLERDGLIETMAEASSEDEKTVYRLTDRGCTELHAWFATPVEGGDGSRDELLVKVALSFDTPHIDARAVLRTQRQATLRTLQELTARKVQLGDDTALGAQAALDLLIARAEAETRWLELCEARVARASRRRKAEA